MNRRRGASAADVIEVERVTTPTDAVRALIAELEADLAKGYAAEQRHGLSLDALFAPHVHFYLATLGDDAVGCGGVALFTDFAEVKRMYVRQNARGRGVGQAILARLEEDARAARLEWLRLETGNVQMAAMRMYARAGFVECGAFGQYAAMDAHAIETSVFYEKRIRRHSNVQ